MIVQSKEAPQNALKVPGNKASTSRISWVDHARGIAILLVVYRHVVIGLQRSGVAITKTQFDIQELFYNFRMPVFFILSGIFVANSLRKKTRVDVLKDRAETVLYPYLVWGVIMVTLEMVFVRFANARRTWWDYLDILIQPRAIDHLWYLYALFNTSALYLLLSRLIKNPWIHGAIAIVLHSVTYLAFLQGNSLVSDAFFFYPYFLIGTLISPVLLDKERADRLLSSRNLLWVVPLFVAGQWYYFMHRTKEEQEGYFPLLFVINLVACYFVYLVARLLERGGNAWLSWLGKYSLYIYILHVPIAAIVRNLASHSGIAFNSWVLIFSCWAIGVTVPILLYQTLTRFGFGKLFSLKNKPAA